MEIQSLKNINRHLVETRNDIINSLESIGNVAVLLNNNSEKLS